MPVRGLRIAVAVMGVMLVIGFVGLVIGIAYRVSHPKPSTTAPPAITAQPFTAAPVVLPAGARIEAVSAGTDRIVLSLVLRDGSRELLLLDMGSGRPVGTIPLHATP